MERFHIIPDADVIVVSNSVYKQLKLYQRAGAIYVGTAGGFVRLFKDGNTGLPKLRWDDIDIPGVNIDALKADGMHKLSLPASRIKQIEGNK